MYLYKEVKHQGDFSRLMVNKKLQRRVSPVYYLHFAEGVFWFCLLRSIWKTEARSEVLQKTKTGETLDNGIKNPLVQYLVSVINMYSRNNGFQKWKRWAENHEESFVPSGMTGHSPDALGIYTSDLYFRIFFFLASG